MGWVRHRLFFHYCAFSSRFFQSTLLFIFPSRLWTVAISEVLCLWKSTFFSSVYEIGLNFANEQPPSTSLICQDFSKITDGISMISLISSLWPWLLLHIPLGGLELPLWQQGEEKKRRYQAATLASNSSLLSKGVRKMSSITS